MKLVVFLALVAFAAARTVQNGPIVVSTPDKVVVVSPSEAQKTNEILEQTTHEPYKREQYGQYKPTWTGDGQRNQYEKQYWPNQEQKYTLKSSQFEIPQYIVYEFQQAQQLGYTVSEVQSYLLRQGFPKFVVQYFTEQYEAFLNQPWGKSPYLAYQYFYDQVIPQEVRQWIIQQINQAYQHYYQFGSKDQQYVWQQNYPYPQSVGQYVTEQGKYNTQNDWSYQFIFQQLQQTVEYSDRAMKYLETGNVPQEIYQYLYKQLQQGQQYIQNAQKVFQKYQSYPQYYIPYYASQYFFQQIQEAYQYYEALDQYIQQQQVQGTWFQSQLYLVEQVRYAYQAIKTAYQTHQQSQFGQPIFSLNYYQALRQVIMYMENIQRHFQGQVNFPQEVIQKFNYAYEIYQALPRLFQEGNLPEPLVRYFWQQVLEANRFLFQVYEFTHQQGNQFVSQQLQYVIQVTRNLQNFNSIERQYWSEYNGQYKPWSQQEKYYEQYYPTTNKQAEGQSWIQKYFNKNAIQTTDQYQGQYQRFPYAQFNQENYPTKNYPTNYNYQEQYQWQPYNQYKQENFPTMKKDFDWWNQRELTKNTYYPTNDKYQEQYQWQPYNQYKQENFPTMKKDFDWWNQRESTKNTYYPTNDKYQEQYQWQSYNQYKQENFPTMKKDFDWWNQRELTKNTYYPTNDKYQEHYQWQPYNQYKQENFPTMKDFDWWNQGEFTKNTNYPTNYKYQEQYLWQPNSQYYQENYPTTNYKSQQQYKTFPYSQYYEQNYPTYKNDLSQYWNQKYLNKDTSNQFNYKSEEQQQQWRPQTEYGYTGPYNYSNQYQYGYYGPYSSTYQYRPYQTSEPNQFFRTFQYRPYSQTAIAA